MKWLANDRKILPRIYRWLPSLSKTTWFALISILLSVVVTISYADEPQAYESEQEYRSLQFEDSEVQSHFYKFSKREFEFTGSNFIFHAGKDRFIGLRQEAEEKVLKVKIYKIKMDFLGHPLLEVIELPEANVENSKVLFNRNYESYRILDTQLIVARKGTVHFLMSVGLRYGQCRTVRVVQVVARFIDDNSSRAKLEILNLRFNTPCIPTSGDSTEGVVLHQSGGALLLEKKEILNDLKPQFLLTLGDFQVLAIEGNDLSQKAKSLLSTVIRVLPNDKFKIIATGTRNAQGITEAIRGGHSKVIFSEHGPRGGDELNELLEGSFYGWPINSLGTNYNLAPQHMPKNTGTTFGSKRPFFSFLPSIGVGKLLQIPRESETHFWWSDKVNSKEKSGDLMLSGMATKSLYRIRWHESGVNYVEPINIGYRTRTFFVDQAGLMWLGTDEGKVLVLKVVSTWNDYLGTFATK